MTFQLIIIGDEIIHGSRVDAHFSAIKTLLTERGLRLHSVQYLPDDRALITEQLKRSFADGIPTFVTGGIGGTPDDHTRQAAAAALNLPLALHAGAVPAIEAIAERRGESLDNPNHLTRLNMATFPEGADLVPNPYNNIAGFSMHEHYFLPGFPVMAHPMVAWVLDTVYPHLHHQTRYASVSVWVYNLPESNITDMMQTLEAEHPHIQTFSLPSTLQAEHNSPYQYRIEFGLKAQDEACDTLPAVWEQVLQQLQNMGGELQTITTPSE